MTTAFIRTSLLFFIFLNTAAIAQKNVQLRGVLPYNKQLSGIWGHTNSTGREYALVGVFDRLSIVDVTNPDSITELFTVTEPGSSWHEIKSWNNHAYVTNEAGDGLLIVDLNYLPDSIAWVRWTGDSILLTAHTLFIDENGILYLFGYNDTARSIPYDERGALICDLNPDPKAPVVLGSYNTDYVHDGFVRGDTLWASQISRGNFAVIDVSDKANPLLLATQETPSRFTHNAWLSDDGQYLFTTDERPYAFIASYDVSDLDNIRELDRWQAEPGSGLIPHNTQFLNQFLINSYYKYGINILDATLPDNLVETGFYDTSPFTNSDGFNGCWGVYPYFPSGTIVASDMEAGLFVMTPTYKRACYMEGLVTDLTTGNPVADVRVEIMATNIVKNTRLNGTYKTGVADSGRYDIRFFKFGCLPQIIASVLLEPGNITTLNVAVNCTTFTSGIEAEPSSVIFSAHPTVFEKNSNIHYDISAIQPYRQTTLKVFDATGKILMSQPLHELSGMIEINAVKHPGVYIVRLENASFNQNIRIVKM